MRAKGAPFGELEWLQTLSRPLAEIDAIEALRPGRLCGGPRTRPQDRSCRLTQMTMEQGFRIPLGASLPAALFTALGIDTIRHLEAWGRGYNTPANSERASGVSAADS